MTSKLTAWFTPIARASISTPYIAHWIMGGSRPDSASSSSSVRFRFAPLDSARATFDTVAMFFMVEFRVLLREPSREIGSAQRPWAINVQDVPDDSTFCFFRAGACAT